MEADDFSIQDLCDQTGLPRRTIHFYTQQGLLPPPQGAGLGARYGKHHLLRLKLIPVLRKQGLRLDQIREKFRQSAPGDLESLHQRMRPLATPPAASTPTRQNYTHYIFPGGITLIVPDSLSAADRQKLNDLLNAAQHIYGQPAFGEHSPTPGSESEIP